MVPGVYPLSPVRRGEGGGEGPRAGTAAFANPHQSRGRPLTLSLSPAYRGEGTGPAPAPTTVHEPNYFGPPCSPFSDVEGRRVRRVPGRPRRGARSPLPDSRKPR